MALKWLGEFDALVCVSSAGDMVRVACDDDEHAIEAVGTIDDVRGWVLTGGLTALLSELR